MSSYDSARSHRYTAGADAVTAAEPASEPAGSRRSTGAIGALYSRVRGALLQRAKVASLRRRLTVTPRPDLALLGTSYGGWTIPTSAMSRDSTCYLAGVGEDASFDLAVIERFGCAVHAFDPVPEAATYAASVSAQEPRFEFLPVGLWSSDGTLRFYQNANPRFVSRSATNMHDTSAFTEAEVRSIGSLMAQFGHSRVDLLKLSVEGSEYEILDDLLANAPAVGTLCVEFAQPAPLAPILARVDALEAAGYRLAHHSLRPFNWRLTFAGAGL